MRYRRRPTLAALVSSVTPRIFGIVLLAFVSYAQAGPATNSQAAFSNPLPAKPSSATQDESIRPFHINVPEEQLVDLRRRIGLAAWILDHDARSQALIARVFDGQTEGLTRDDILDNITLYWLTNTAVSSARLYWEYKGAFFDPRGVPIPTAVSVFPDEIYAAPKSWTQKAYPKLIYYNRVPKGGHFAAWEQPELFSEELRAAFRSLR
jgi:pimeloyl-ACP methyl ester carboxylesterase